MAIGKTITTLISNGTIPANSSLVSSSSVNLAGAIDLELTCTLAFNASSNGGARVELYSDPSGANSSFSVGSNDEPLDSFDILRATGTKSKSEQMKHSSIYAKVKIVNLGNQSITGAYVRAFVQTQ